MSVLAEIVGSAVGGVVEAEEGEGDGVGPLAVLTIISCCLVAANTDLFALVLHTHTHTHTHTHFLERNIYPGVNPDKSHLAFLNTGCEDKTIHNIRW